MKNQLLTAISTVLILLIAALTVYVTFISDEKDYRLAAKAVVVIITYILALTGFKKSMPVGYKDYRIYMDRYKDILEGTFQYDKKSFKKLIKAVHLYNCSKYANAVKILDSLMDKCTSSDDFSAVLMFRALCLSDQKLTNEAADAYEELLKYDVRNSRAWSNLGMIYADSEKTEEAYRAYENAIAYDPENAHAYNNIAVCYIRSGNAQKALDNALYALKLNGKLYPAMSAAAVAYKMLGDNENAEKYCKMYGANGGKASELRKAMENI